MKYFESFPTINYEGYKVKDITRRTNFTQIVAANPTLYLPFTVKEGEKPETIAEYYYGSTDYTWLVYMANNILDPYHQWPMAEAEFNAYLIEKYGEVSGRVGEDIVDWTREDNVDNIIYYYREV